MYSVNGYRRYSRDVDNAFNIIPSDRISMKGVDFPVIGVDEFGIIQFMQPEKEYQFPGNTVFEVPIKQAGGSHNAQSQTKKPVTQTNDKRDYIAENNLSYQWSDAPINITPLSVPSAYKITEGGSDSETAYINPIQEQLRLAKLALKTFDSAADDQLRALYNTTPHQVLYEYDEDYRNRMDYNASQNPYKIEYPKTDLRRGDNIPPNTAWMYPNLTGQTRAAMTTQANQDLAFDIMGAGMASKYFKGANSTNKVLKNVDNTTDLIGDAWRMNNSNNIVKNKFKSEIDWRKWNKEIPDNPQLMKEYNAIEQQAKADGTWMKNPDGSVFKGTPEQFIQQNSENFKKAFPEGYNEVWRGVNERNASVNLNPEKGVFTANKELSKNYANKLDNTGWKNVEINPQILSSLDNDKVGLFNLAHKKSINSIELDNFGREWTSIDLTNPKQSIDNINLNIKNLEKQVEKQRNWLKTGKQNSDGSWSFPDSDIQYSDYLYKQGTVEQEKILKSYKDRLENINNLVKNPKELEKMKSVLGNLTTTDDIAKYIEDVNLDYVKIKNVEDGSFGDVSIINHKKGNYLKSLVGNNGMFDMNNPNIYKSIIPAIATAGAIGASQKKYQSGGTVGMDGMMKAKLALDSHFGNPTARRMTNYDTRNYKFDDGSVGNVYVSSYDNLVTPHIQLDENNNLIYVDDVWSDNNKERSYQQSMKFEREEDAEYFGKNYKRVAPMKKLYQDGGYAQEEDPTTQLLYGIAEALQQGSDPREILNALKQNGVPEEQAMELIKYVMEQMQQQAQLQKEEKQQLEYAQDGKIVRKYNVEDLDWGKGINRAMLAFNMLQTPGLWQAPVKHGVLDALNAGLGLAAGLSGVGLGYSKLGAKKEYLGTKGLEDEDPKEKPIVSSPYIPEGKDVTKVVKPSLEISTWDWQTQHPDLTAANMTGKASYSVPKKEYLGTKGLEPMKKLTTSKVAQTPEITAKNMTFRLTDSGTKGLEPIVSSPYIPEGKDVTKVVKPSSEIPTWDWQTQHPNLTDNLNQLLVSSPYIPEGKDVTKVVKPSSEIPTWDWQTLRSLYPDEDLSTKQDGGYAQEEDPTTQLLYGIAEALQQGSDPREVLNALKQNGVPEEQAMELIKYVIEQMQQQAQLQKEEKQQLEYAQDGKIVRKQGDQVMNMTSMNQMNPEFLNPEAFKITFNSMYPYLNLNNAESSSIKTKSKDPEDPEDNVKKEEIKQTFYTGDPYGMLMANNALVGFQKFNDYLSDKDYEKEYNRRMMQIGNTNAKYNPVNYDNPYGTYTPNVGIGSNYGLVANGPIQDFGTGMFMAEEGGRLPQMQRVGIVSEKTVDPDRKKTVDVSNKKSNKTSGFWGKIAKAGQNLLDEPLIGRTYYFNGKSYLYNPEAREGRKLGFIASDPDNDTKQIDVDIFDFNTALNKDQIINNYYRKYYTHKESYRPDDLSKFKLERYYVSDNEENAKSYEDPDFYTFRGKDAEYKVPTLYVGHNVKNNMDRVIQKDGKLYYLWKSFLDDSHYYKQTPDYGYTVGFKSVPKIEAYPLDSNYEFISDEVKIFDENDLRNAKLAHNPYAKKEEEIVEEEIVEEEPTNTNKTTTTTQLSSKNNTSGKSTTQKENSVLYNPNRKYASMSFKL